MKRILSVFLSVILLLTLTACSGTDAVVQAEIIQVNTAQDSETYVEGEDYQQSTFCWGSLLADTFTKGESGYYFCDSFLAKKLCYYDIATDTALLLCNQPNCEHRDQSCNAVLTKMLCKVLSIQYYDGNLYLFGYETPNGDFCLYRMSADGSTYGKVGSFTSTSDYNVNFSCVVHRGYAYCAMNSNDLNKQETNVYRLSLGGGEEAEVVHTFDKAYGGGADLKAYGNYLYMEHQRYADADANGYNGDLYRMNIHDGTVELVCEGACRGFAADENYVYYDRTTQIIARNLETGKETVVAEPSYPVYMALGGGYLVLDNGCGLSLSGDDNGDKTDDYSERCIRVMNTATLAIINTVPLPMSITDAELVAWQDSRLVINIPFFDEYEEDGYSFVGNLNKFCRGDILTSSDPEWVPFHTQSPK